MLSLLSSISMQFVDPATVNCKSAQSDRDKHICSYYDVLQKLEIKTVDDVAVGTNEEMFSLKPIARSCKLLNNVDYIDEKTSFLKIINASQESKTCIIQWIRSNKPKLELTPEKKEELGFVQ